jgi:hypothetical protein
VVQGALEGTGIHGGAAGAANLWVLPGGWACRWVQCPGWRATTSLIPSQRTPPASKL